VKRVLVTARTKLFRLELFGMSLRIFSRRVVDFATLAALESYIDSHLY
jgi:hypothetical protein